MSVPIIPIWYIGPPAWALYFLCAMIAALACVLAAGKGRL